ncbi:tryptophan 2,3-dioxygenase [Pseudonocardia sp. GCM10023141]|uniref:tryptophan 2,3-dioxygenase n=1 Tax=Pseudonocardia sp. GCM10023141 TaxID=3252653 RepID=UPI00360D5DFA
MSGGPDRRTAYDSYLRARELHELQSPVSATEGEQSFLVVCQVQELWFGLIGTDLRTARAHLDADRPQSAAATLRRAASHFGGLNASWDSLSWMTPRDFHPIKQGMTATHGRSSSLQSWKYRELTFLLGLKDPALAEPVADVAEQHDVLQAALRAPSVYDAALGVLHRRGFTVPAAYAEPGAAQPPGGHREPRADVERAWGAVYAGAAEHADLRALADALFAVAEGFAGYKHRHLVATRRTLGRRPAYYASGVDWLLGAIDELPFPEMWTLHTPDE